MVTYLTMDRALPDQRSSGVFKFEAMSPSNALGADTFLSQRAEALSEATVVLCDGANSLERRSAAVLQMANAGMGKVALSQRP